LLRLSPRRLEAAAVAALVGGFLVLAGHRLERPGLHSDELLFATPALGAGGATYDPWLHLPLMVGGYLGALKAYLFMPLFAVWAPSAWSIRIPDVLMGAGALLLFWLFVRRTGGVAAGLLALLLLAFDPSYAFAARVDWGPTLLMQVFKGLSLLAVAHVVDEGRLRWLWALLLFSLLGLYDKLNYIWVVNALAVASLAHAPRLARLARAEPRRFWPPVALLAAVTAVLFVGAILTLLGEARPEQAALTLVQRVGHTWTLVAGTFDGSLIHDWVVLEPLRRWPVALVLHLPLLLLAVALVARRRDPWTEDQRRLGRWLAFCLLAALAVFAQLVATRAVWGAHHVLVLWPFPQAAVALAAALAWRRAAPARALRAALATAAGAAVVLVLAAQAQASVHYERRIYAVATIANPLFTPEIYGLSRFVNARLPRVASVVTADWGLRYPLRVLGPPAERDKVRDFWLVFREFGRGDGRGLYKEWFADRTVMVISYRADRPVFAASDTNWRAFREKHLLPRGHVYQAEMGTYEITCVGPDAGAAEVCAVPSTP
jgi:hypothetical protein